MGGDDGAGEIVMSFLSVIKNIGHIVVTGEAIIAPLAPLIESVVPAKEGNIFATVLQGIMIAEQLVGPTSVTNTGAQKKTLALAVVNAVHPGLDQTALGTAVDGLVAALNQITTAAEAVPAPVAPAAPAKPA